MTRPLLRFENDAFLILHEAHRILSTGDTRIRSLDEISNVDFEVEQDVFLALDLLRWLEDYTTSLPAHLKELVEKPTQKEEA